MAFGLLLAVEAKPKMRALGSSLTASGNSQVVTFSQAERLRRSRVAGSLRMQEHDESERSSQSSSRPNVAGCTVGQPEMFLSTARASIFRTRATTSSSASVPQVNREDVDSAVECFGVGHEILGIDIGGTSIKAAVVDTRTGLLLTEKHVILTPKPATPERCADIIGQMVEHFKVIKCVWAAVARHLRHQRCRGANEVAKPEKSAF